MLDMYHDELFARLYFWPFVDTSGGADACWHWKGVRNSTRQNFWLTYGIVRVFGKEISAHRYSLQLKLGEPLNKLFALHSCDNPRCCNPAHLRPGTAKDNSDDKALRGRHRVNTIEACLGCVVIKGRFACYICSLKANPAGINDPEVLRLSAMMCAEEARQEKEALEAELLEEDYLDLADEYVSNQLSLPRPVRLTFGPLLHRKNLEEEEAFQEFICEWRDARTASSTCVGRGRFARGEEGGISVLSVEKVAPLSVQCGGCGASTGEACAAPPAPPETAAPPDAPARIMTLREFAALPVEAYAGTATPSEPATPAPIMTLRELVASGVKFRGRLTEAQRAIVLASLREGYTLAETVAATEVWRSAALVRQDARVQGWAAELAAAVKDGALARGER